MRGHVILSHYRAKGTFLESLLQKAVPIELLSRNGNKKIPSPGSPGIRANALKTNRFVPG
jgi:hypothetical protein